MAKRAIPPRKGAACILRVAKEELGIEIETENVKLLGVYEDIDKDPRGYVIDLVYSAKIPEKIGFIHGEVLRELGCE